MKPTRKDLAAMRQQRLIDLADSLEWLEHEAEDRLTRSEVSLAWIAIRYLTERVIPTLRKSTK